MNHHRYRRRRLSPWMAVVPACMLGTLTYAAEASAWDLDVNEADAVSVWTKLGNALTLPTSGWELSPLQKSSSAPTDKDQQQKTPFIRVGREANGTDWHAEVGFGHVVGIAGGKSSRNSSLRVDYKRTNSTSPPKGRITVTGNLDVTFTFPIYVSPYFHVEVFGGVFAKHSDGTDGWYATEVGVDYGAAVGTGDGLISALILEGTAKLKLEDSLLFRQRKERPGDFNATDILSVHSTDLELKISSGAGLITWWSQKVYSSETSLPLGASVRSEGYSRNLLSGYDDSSEDMVTMRSWSEVDWDYGYYKATCGGNKTLHGVSREPTTNVSHFAECYRDNNYSMGADYYDTAVQGAAGEWYALKFAGEDQQISDGHGLGDWAPYYYKLECGSGDYAAGISQKTTGGIHGLLCVRGGDQLRNTCSCSVRTIDSGDDRADTNYGEWAVNEYKAECSGTEFVAGVSINSSGKLHSILCCPRDDAFDCVQQQTNSYTDSPAVDGSYYSLTIAASGSCIDAEGGGTADGTNVQQWHCNATAAQSWKFVATDSGYFKLVNLNSGLCLDVSGGGTSNGTNVQLWSCDGTPEQEFMLVPVDGDYYSLVDRNSGKCVDVDGGMPQDGTNVQLWECNGTVAQQFRLDVSDYSQPPWSDPWLGNLVGRHCDYAAWGNGSMANHCSDTTVQYCLPSGLFSDCSSSSSIPAAPEPISYEPLPVTTASASVGGRAAKYSLIRSIAAAHGITKAGYLIAGIAEEETNLAHCWSEATWACQGPASVDCDGGPVIAGSADGYCYQQLGGLGLFQHDWGTYTDTINALGTHVLTLAGNIEHGVLKAIDIVRDSAYISGVYTDADAIAWLNRYDNNNSTLRDQWIKTAVRHYNGCLPTYSCWGDRYDDYNHGLDVVVGETGVSYWSGAFLQTTALSRAEGIAPQNRPYLFDGVQDCYGYVRQVWNAILSDGGAHTEDYYPNAYSKSRWLGVSNGLPVNDYPSSNWIYFSDPSVLRPGDVLATHQGHMWGSDWHGGIYAGYASGQHWNWDNSKMNGLDGAYKRPLYSGFHYYYKPVHDSLGTTTMAPSAVPGTTTKVVGNNVFVAHGDKLLWYNRSGVSTGANTMYAEGNTDGLTPYPGYSAQWSNAYRGYQNFSSAVTAFDVVGDRIWVALASGRLIRYRLAGAGTGANMFWTDTTGVTPLAGYQTQFANCYWGFQDFDSPINAIDDDGGNIWVGLNNGLLLYYNINNMSSGANTLDALPNGVSPVPGWESQFANCFGGYQPFNAPVTEIEVENGLYWVGLGNNLLIAYKGKSTGNYIFYANTTGVAPYSSAYATQFANGYQGYQPFDAPIRDVKSTGDRIWVVSGNKVARFKKAGMSTGNYMFYANETGVQPYSSDYSTQFSKAYFGYSAFSSRASGLFDDGTYVYIGLDSGRWVYYLLSGMGTGANNFWAEQSGITALAGYATRFNGCYRGFQDF